YTRPHEHRLGCGCLVYAPIEVYASFRSGTHVRSEPASSLRYREERLLDPPIDGLRGGVEELRHGGRMGEELKKCFGRPSHAPCGDQMAAGDSDRNIERDEDGTGGGMPLSILED